MRGGEIRKGIDVFIPKDKSGTGEPESLGKSKKAAILAVGETAFSRVMNATPIMVIPPLVLVRLQEGWLKNRPGWTIPINLGTWKRGYGRRLGIVVLTIIAQG